MGSILNLSPPGVALPALLALFLSLFLLRQHIHLRAQRKKSEVELLRFSNLHLIGAGMSAPGGLVKVVEETLDRALRTLDAPGGYLWFQTPDPEELDRASARGLSAAATQKLSSGPLRDYLRSCTHRWGNLMVFPDLRKPELVVAWQRDPQFHEFREIFLAEGLRSLAVIGFHSRGKFLGALIVGSRKLRPFLSVERRLMLAIGNQISVALENRSLHKRTDRHNEELRSLHRIGRGLNTTFDLGKQVQFLAREMKGLLGSAVFYLAFRETPDGPLEVQVAEGGDAAETGLEMTGLAEYVLRTRSPLLITHSLAAEVRRLGISPVDGRIRSWCGVPIPFSGESAGVLAVASVERERTFDDSHLQLLQVLAGEVSVAIKNSRLFQQEQQRARHLAVLNELGRKAAAVLDPRELLSSICRQIRDAFGYDLVRYEAFDRVREELVVEAQEGYGTDLIGRRFKKGEGLAWAAVESGEPLLSSDVEQHPRYIPLVEGVQSALNLPLSYGGDLLGALSIESRHKGHFSAQDVLTLRTLVDQLAIALHNACAYQEAQEQAVTDSLTGLKTHRYFMEALEAEWRRTPRSGRPFSVIMMDLDGFKEVNDRGGHLEGDKVLIAVARLLKARLRHFNVISRYGGDEFVILVPEGGTEQAEILAERIRTSIAADAYLTSRGVTASFGIATFPTHGATPEEILRFADAGMYLAKHERGDRVRVASQLAQPGSPEGENQLLEAYLGVAVKRMFSTGPDTFEQYLHRFEQATEEISGESLSLMDTVTALAFAIDAKDHYTQGHSQSVARLAVQIARQFGLPDSQVEEIRLAGIVHDIGKIGVPETVLNKPARLTPEEYEIMKTHAVLGWKILEPLKVKAIERIRKMVRHHHESFNGKGYPDGLRGQEIPLGARILTVADAFDTMVSERAYKKGLTVEAAVGELQRCRGAHFDAALVDTFVKSLDAVGDPRRREALEQAAN